MKWSNRIIAVILTFAIGFSLTVPSFAASGGGSVSLLVDSTSVSGWNSYIDNHTKVNFDFLTVVKPGFWNVIDSAYADAGIGNFESLEKLTNAASIWTNRAKWHDTSFGTFFPLHLDCDRPEAVVAYDSDQGVYRFRDRNTGAWLVNSMGHFAYYKPADGSSGDTPAYEYQWLRYDQITGFQAGTAIYEIIPYSMLQEVQSVYGAEAVIQEQGNYFYICRTPVRSGYYLCTMDGHPVVSIRSLNDTALNTPLDYNTSPGGTTSDGDTIYNEGDTQNSLIISAGENLFWMPDGTLQYIDHLTYDGSTKTYTVDSHDSYTWNETTNNYVTNNYNYLVQYHINYTSITYIGQTAEYDKKYECYYELPDGRSSADLTAEDLEQLSMVFKGVIPYARSADELTLRRLFHFDGNTEDSSYWSYIENGFEWVIGASLTYMESGAFEGALYLDEQRHKFNINLPNADLFGDFTLQFRYYQSYTAAPAFDSTISAGSVDLLQLSGAAAQTGDGVAAYPIPTGSWNELCIMRSGDKLYYYINGVLQSATQTVTGSLGDTFVFDFGSTQQTYKYLDELRVTRAAIYVEDGTPVNYTPTAVPFDTNLTLVLPDSDIPIADEYVTITPSSKNLLRYNFMAGSDLSIPVVNCLKMDSSTMVDQSSWLSACAGDLSTAFGLYAGPYLSLSGSSVGTTFTSLSSSSSVYHEHADSIYTGSGFSSRTYFLDASYLAICLDPMGTDGYVVRDSSGSYAYNSGRYLLSVVGIDGSVTSLDFKLARSFSSNSGITINSYVPDGPVTLGIGYITGSVDSFVSSSFGLQSFAPYCGSTTSSTNGCSHRVIAFSIPALSSVDIAYVELVSGSAADYTFDYHYAVYSPDDLTDSPILAVRTNRDITGYQIGGMRPSYPTAGLVYALVENSRITSLQQYTGFAWEAVDGRIWTGERWVPYSSFDVFTLKDYWDITGAATDEDFEYIYTETGFWSWWQRAWNSFTAKVDVIISLLGGDTSGDGGSSTDNKLLPDAEDDSVDDDGSSSGGFSFLDLLSGLLSGTWGVVKGLVRVGGNSFTDFIGQINSIPDSLGRFDPGSEDGIYFLEDGGGTE